MAAPSHVPMTTAWGSWASRGQAWLGSLELGGPVHARHRVPPRGPQTPCLEWELRRVPGGPAGREEATVNMPEQPMEGGLHGDAGKFRSLSSESKAAPTSSG